MKMTADAYFSRAANLQRLHEGPLGIYIDLYATRLVGEGYCQLTAWRCLHLVGDFSRWLERRQLGVRGIDEQVVATYLGDRAGQRHRQTSDRPALKKLLEVLREVDAIAAQGPVELSPWERIFGDFAGYLARERGLARNTIICHLPAVRLFLKEEGIKMSLSRLAICRRL